MKRIIHLLGCLLLIISSINAQNIPAGYSIDGLPQKTGVDFYKHGSGNHYVIKIDLEKGASVELITNDITNPDLGNAVYGCKNPEFDKSTIGNIWREQFKPNFEREFALINGAFFIEIIENINFWGSSSLSFPMVANQQVISGGHADESPLKILEIWNHKAIIKDFNTQNTPRIPILKQTYSPNAIIGKPLDFDDSTLDGRTIVGVGESKNLLFFFISKAASFQTSANVLIEFGATEFISLDGGGSTKLFGIDEVHNQPRTYISLNEDANIFDNNVILPLSRWIPQTIGITYAPSETIYSDISTDDHFYPYFKEGYKNHLLETEDQLEILPNKLLTRKEVAKMVATALDLSTDLLIQNSDYFTDVDPCVSYFPYIQALKNLNIIEGDGGGNMFNPDTLINRAETVKILVKAFNIPEVSCTTSNFADVNTSDWFCPYVHALYNTKVRWVINDNSTSEERIIEGFPDGTFRPSNSVTKAEFVKMLINSFNYANPNIIFQGLSSGNNTLYTLGKKVELTSSPFGSPSNVAIDQEVYEISDSETLTLDFGSDQDFYGKPFHFYWVSDQPIVSLHPNHRAIEFIAPTVSMPTDYYVHAWIGGENGKVNQQTFTITLCPSSDPSCSGNTNANNADFQVSAYSLSYEDTWELALRDKEWRIINSTGNPLRIKGEIVSGNANFRIRSQTGGYDNDGLDKVLPVWEDEIYKIAFDPSTSGTLTGQFVLHYGNNLEYSFVLPLSGVAYGSDPITIDPPSNLHFTDPREFGFKVNFRNPENGVKHIVEYANNSNFTGAITESFISTTSNVAWRIQPPAYGTWWVRVKSQNNALGLTSEWANPDKYIWQVDTEPRIYDNMLSPLDETIIGSFSTVNLSFQGQGGNGTLKYTVWLATANPLAEPPIVQNSTSSSFTVNNLLPNERYYWRVRVTDENGDFDESNTIFFDTPPDQTPPTCNLQIENGASTANTLSVNLNITSNSTNGIVKYMRFSNDGNSWSIWYPYSPVYAGWGLIPFGGNPNTGNKTVYVSIKDNSGNITVCHDDITIIPGSPGIFWVRNMQFASLRQANEYAQAGDTIYATEGIYDLTSEVDNSPYGYNSDQVGIAFKDGVSLVGAGMDRTTLYWNDGATGIVIKNDNFVQGLTLIRPTPPLGSRNTVVLAGHNSILSHCRIKGGSRPIYPHTSGESWNNIVIQKCIIDGNDDGLRLHYLNNPRIINNVIALNGGFNTLNILPTTTNAIVKNNIFYQNTNGSIQLDGIGGSYTNNCLLQLFAGDHTNTNGNIEVDPVFLNPATGNFQLQSNSPCRNSGTDVELAFAESAPDMGAFEYGGIGELSLTSNKSANFTLIKPDGTIINDQSFNFDLSSIELGMIQVYPQAFGAYYTPGPKFVNITSNETQELHFEYLSDTIGPDILMGIAGGSTLTFNPLVSLYIGATDPVNGVGDSTSSILVSPDGIIWPDTFPANNKIAIWNTQYLDSVPTEGYKKVYVKVSDNLGYFSETITDSVFYKPPRFIHVPVNSTLDYFFFDSLQVGDVLILEDGTYYISSSNIPPGIRIQGKGNSIFSLNNSSINIQYDTHIDGVYFIGNGNPIYINNGRVALTNCTFDNVEHVRLFNSNAHGIIRNCLFKNFSTSSTSYILSYSFLGIDISNCVFDGLVDNNAVFQKNAIRLDGVNGNIAKSKIINNIFLNFDHPHSSSGAINIDNDDYSPGNIFISNNNYYNTTVDVVFDGPAMLNLHPLHIDPLFENNSYHLTTNSPLIGAGFPSPFYFNHQDTKGNIGLRGGLITNSLPLVQANTDPEIAEINELIIFSAESTDEETPPQYLYTCWDFNEDGICETPFLLDPSFEYQYDFNHNDSVTCYVLDEHGAITYHRIANPLAPLADSLPGAISLIFPLDSAVIDVNTPNLFNFENQTGYGNRYCLEVSHDSLFENIAYRDTNLVDTFLIVESLPYVSNLYWRVNATNNIGTGPWSTFRMVNSSAICNIDSVQYNLRVIEDTTFTIDISFAGENRYTISDGDTSLTNQSSGNFTLGNYSLGERVSITIFDEIASNCTEVIPSVTVGPTLNIDGSVLLPDSVNSIANVSMNLSGDTLVIDTTGPDGLYLIQELAYEGDYLLKAEKDDPASLDLTNLDLILIKRHILGTNTFTSPFQYIAADINGDNQVTNLDLIMIKHVILGNWTSFQNNRVWYFIPFDYQFPEPTSPYPFPELDPINNLKINLSDRQFIGVKLGNLYR